MTSKEAGSQAHGVVGLLLNGHYISKGDGARWAATAPTAIFEQQQDQVLQ